MSVKLTAEMPATELIAKDEDEKDCVLKFSCEGLEPSEVILELEDGRKFKMDGSDLMENLARISQEWPSVKKENDE